MNSLKNEYNKYHIEHYLTSDQRNLYLDWLRRMRDARAKVAIVRRVGRMEQGNFGDRRFCRDGVWELRIDVGPGYRLYYALAGSRLILLLVGGDKRSQHDDMERAVECWQDWQRR